MKYYIIAGEASGDLHGSNLIRGLVAEDPAAEIRFWGGDKMSEAAADRGTLVRHYKESSIMGFWEVIKKLRALTRQMEFCRRDIATYRPDVLILIDYPGFNLRMARFVHEKMPGTKVFYYIAPKVWAWKESRVKKLRAWVDKLFIIFPFEIEYFRRHGIEGYYTGNPIMDSMAQREAVTPESRREFLSRSGLPDKPIIALVPGSRKGEIEFNLPHMVTVSALFPDYQFVVTGVSWLDRSLYDTHLAGSNIGFVCDQTYETISHASAALVTSGTATLETALLGVPEVVCYRGSGISYVIAKRLVSVPFISLVNLILGREAVRELIQYEYTSENTATELCAILPGGDRHKRMQQDFAELRELMGEPGASRRVAAEMIRILKESRI